MKIIGITGNSGSGKTYISKEIAKNTGAKIINADETVKKMYSEKSKYYKAIVKEFGEEILLPNKEINRKKLAEIIYKSKEKLLKINKLTKKYVAKEIKKEVKQTKTKILILDIPLLFENKLEKICDITIAIIANEEEKLKRICSRDSITKEMAKARIEIQTKEEEYIKKADYIIDNNKENEEKAIQKILKIILEE